MPKRILFLFNRQVFFLTQPTELSFGGTFGYETICTRRIHEQVQITIRRKRNKDKQNNGSKTTTDNDISYQ